MEKMRFLACLFLFVFITLSFISYSAEDYGPVRVIVKDYDHWVDGEFKSAERSNQGYTPVTVKFFDGENSKWEWNITGSGSLANDIAEAKLGGSLGHSWSTEHSIEVTITIPGMKTIGCGCPSLGIPSKTGLRWFEHRELAGVCKLTTKYVMYDYYWNYEAGTGKQVVTSGWYNSCASKNNFPIAAPMSCAIRHFSECFDNDQFQNPFTLDKKDNYYTPGPGIYVEQFDQIQNTNPNQERRLCVILSETAPPEN